MADRSGPREVRRPETSESDKRAALGHVAYEVYRCAECAAAWPRAMREALAHRAEAEESAHTAQSARTGRTREAAEIAAAAAQQAANYTAVVADALLEAQLLHARSIIEFLLRPVPGQPSTADLLRSDFLSPGTADWTARPSDAVGRLTRHLQDINRHLSHLSWDRIVAGRGWDYHRISHDVLAVADAWNAYLGEHSPGMADEMRGPLAWARTALGQMDGPDPPGSTLTTTSPTTVTTPRRQADGR